MVSEEDYKRIFSETKDPFIRMAVVDAWNLMRLTMWWKSFKGRFILWLKAKS